MSLVVQTTFSYYNAAIRKKGIAYGKPGGKIKGNKETAPTEHQKPAAGNKVISHNCRELQKALANTERNSWMKETQFYMKKPYKTGIH